MEEIGVGFSEASSSRLFRIVDSHFGLMRVLAKFLEAKDANVSNADAANHVWDKLGCVS